jgi:hypothetical protein
MNDSKYQQCINLVDGGPWDVEDEFDIKDEKNMKTCKPLQMQGESKC